MLTGYTRISQEGIEALKDPYKIEKAEEGGHCYFDKFRIAIHFHLNEEEKSTGVGILTFAPNGDLWSESGEYCYELNELGSLFLGIEEALKEARRELATPFNVEEVILAIPDEDALAKNPKEILKSEIQKYENDFKEFKSQLLIDDRLEDVEVVIETGKGTPEDLYAANTYRGFEKKIVAHQKALEKKELESQ